MKRYWIIMASAIIVIVGIVKVNMKNTVALSPVGNFEDNFNMVSEEFGEDFSEFIMDKSPVKIYLGEIGDNVATVKINENDITLTKDNPFLKIFNPLINFFKNSYSKVESWIGEKMNKNDLKEDTAGGTSEIDGVVDDFINSLDSE